MDRKTGQAGQRHPLVVRSLAWTAVGLILLAVFTMYLQPDFLVLLANQIWLCF
ncbi:MAG: hypothetical protein Q7K57_10190 [Burkholderiaceae bacterium]|nr:hypothetical protein [Burkholderiaceae bacterium]